MTAPLKATSITGLPNNQTRRPKTGGALGWWIDNGVLYVAENPADPHVETYGLDADAKLLQYGRTYRYGKVVMSGCQTCGGNPWKQHDTEKLTALMEVDG